MNKATAEERFWMKVDPEPLSGCWLWTACLARGYGTFWDGMRLVLAHRFAYELLRGPIPQDLQLDHLCRVRSCVNPAHLEPVTLAENLRRGVNGRGNRTHCPKGHPYDSDNTRTWLAHNGNRWRYCKTCHRKREAARRLERKVAT